MSLLKIDVWRSIKKKRERLKVYLSKQKGGDRTVWKENESGCRF